MMSMNDDTATHAQTEGFLLLLFALPYTQIAQTQYSDPAELHKPLRYS